MLTTEVAPATKEKRKRSAKSKRETPPQPTDWTIQTHPATEPALNGPIPVLNGPTPLPAKPTYEWDRTVEEDAKRQESIRISRTPFPTPNKTTLPFADLCEYYNALRETPVGRYAKLYVSRWWPVLMPVDGVDDFGNPKESFPNDVKITAEDGPLSQQLLLQIAGVGEYKFRLNDTRRPWKQQTVVFSELELIDPSLWSLHPAVIDPKRIDLDAKRNQSYIKFARSHGYLPHEGAEEKETSEMANAAVATQALEDARKERARADEIQTQELQRARQEAAEAKRQAEQAKAETSANQEIKPGTPAAELLSVVTSVAALANSIKPEPDTSLKDYLALEAEREQTRRERDKEERDHAREEAKAERERADKLQAQILADMTARNTAATTAIATAPAMDEVSILEREVKKKGLLKQLYGKPAEEDDAGKPSSVDKWLEVVPMAMPIIGSMFRDALGFGMAWFQTSQINSYNAACAATGKTPQQPSLMNGQQNQNQPPPKPGEPMPPQAPPPSPEQTAQQQAFNQIMANVVKIAPYMIRHINKGKPGAEFAEFIIENAPDERADYDRIRGIVLSLTNAGFQVPGANEIEQFHNACRFVFEKYPPLWAKVGTVPTMPQFLTDFYNYDQILEQANSQEPAE